MLNTFYAAHKTATYLENIEDFPMKFWNIDISTDDIIFDASFNDTFRNPTHNDAFQTPRYMPDYLESNSGLDSGQMDPNIFGNR